MTAPSVLPSRSAVLPSRSAPTPLRRRVLALIGACCVLLSPLVGLQAAAAADRLVLDHQHTDAVSVRYENDALVLKTRADLDTGAGQVLDPNDVVFHVTDAQKDVVPDLPGYGFLGEPGAELWMIPQRYQQGALWAGWETETLPRGTFAGDAVRLSVTDITGPGRVEIFFTEAAGPDRVISSSDASLRTIHEYVGTHTHANWAFTAPGTYVLTVVAEADLAGGGTIRSAAQQYTFWVGPAGGDPQPTPTPSGTPTPTPTPTPTATPTPTVSPTPTAEPTASPAPGGAAPGGAAPGGATPGGAGAQTPTASPTQAEEQCIATPVTTTVRPDNVDVVTSGHFDFGPVLEGGTLRALVKDDRAAPPVWTDPGTLVFHLTDAAAAQAPGGDFSFLGSGRVWQIPLTQQSGVPWIGWNTQHPSIAGHAQGQVALTLEGFDGPGDLAVYSVGSWGQLGEQYFGTVAGFPRSTNIDVGASGVHVHGIWAFTQPGAYHVDLAFSGTIDGERHSATSTLTFFVGDGDPRSAVREREVTTSVGRTADGADCRLSLAQTGAEGDRFAIDLAGLAGALLLVGLAFVGAAALAPRTRRAS